MTGLEALQRFLKATLLFALVAGISAATAGAADQAPIKIGVLWAYSVAGSSSSAGPQLDAAIAAYQHDHGATIAGHPVQFIRRDTTGPQEETVRRLAQELIVDQQVDLIMGCSFSPDAITLGPISSQAKKPVFIVNAATDNVMKNAPYETRLSVTNGQMTAALAQWAHAQGYHTMVSFVSDYVTGVDAAQSFKKFYEANGGGTVVSEIRPPLLAKDFAPYLLHVRDAKPDAMFVFLGAAENGRLFFREFHDLGLDKMGVKIIAIGALLEDDAIDAVGDESIGTISAYNYSGALQTAENKHFLQTFSTVTGAKLRPNYAAYAGYDTLTAISLAIAAQGGGVDPDRMMQAVRGMRFTGPRGPILIDPHTRDMVANIYLRRVERRGDHLVNVIIATIPMVRNPNETYDN
jgi:branched-chain amino acid transport system substrate-binding protein